MHRVRQFLHLSDLHIGLPDEKGDARVLMPLAALPWFDGLMGHSYNSLRKIEALFRKVSRSGRTDLIFTGDLTSNGHDNEFTAGSEYLDSDWTLPTGNFVGLRCPAWKELAVPGNHDHWPGAPTIFGPPQPSLTTTFKRTPYYNDPIRLATGHTLRFIGIDTDRDVNPHLWQRLFARGSFISELNELETNGPGLPLPEEGEIRALLLHHSVDWPDYVLGVAATSRKALLEFCVQAGISVLLCGHTHEVALKTMEVNHLKFGRPTPVVQACCGSSSRRTTLPMNANVLGYRFGRPSWLPNSVLLHTFEPVRGGPLRWRIQAMYETPRGFSSIESVPSHQDSIVLEFPAGSGAPDQAG